MGRLSDPKAKTEFGDFQTPPALAHEVCRLLAARDFRPKSILEPTCGEGNLLLAAMRAFPSAEHAIGLDVNAAHVDHARAMLRATRPVTITRGNFFYEDWHERIGALPQPLLVIGNPPWITSANLGVLKSHNAPTKTNFHRRAGLDALTGKSNFDVSEWMLLKLLSVLDSRAGVLAMLCKTAVARKVLAYSWSIGTGIARATTYRIDAAQYFNAAVDACLLVCELGERDPARRCLSFDSLAARRPRSAFGHRDGSLIADLAAYQRRKHLAGESPYKWRSGVKHDCAGVMELRRRGTRYENGHGEPVEIEHQLLYPMLKSSEVARVGPSEPVRAMIVTQRFVGEDTAPLRTAMPRTWRYLYGHIASFERRASSIYRGKPVFSIFGVGDYTFAPWKLAISGLYKKLEFRVVGPHGGKPVVLDDTCYFLACESEAEARFLASLLASDIARDFYSAFVFWDAKRPITTDLLRRLDLWRLAQELGHAPEYRRLCQRASFDSRPDGSLDRGARRRP